MHACDACDACDASLYPSRLSELICNGNAHRCMDRFPLRQAAILCPVANVVSITHHVISCRVSDYPSSGSPVPICSLKDDPSDVIAVVLVHPGIGSKEGHLRSWCRVERSRTPTAETLSRPSSQSASREQHVQLIFHFGRPRP